MALQQSARTTHHHPHLGLYEFPCPRCRKGIAYPHRVTTKGPTAILVGLVCDGCRYEWNISRTMKDGHQVFQAVNRSFGSITRLP